ncbi:MAG: histidinol-phosphate transaminase [Eudoraea sp.]|nr:histidinol-phosphate transaminase [Eudoraea sp.]
MNTDNSIKFDLNRLVRENVKGLQPYSSARDEYLADGSEKIFLDANENPFQNGVNRYPDPQQQSLKSILAERNGLDKGQILLGNGSDEILDLIFRAFCEPKTDNIITMPPTYGMYKVLAGINDIENREVLLTNGFQLDVAAILKATDTNTKAIFFCSPNNPTGNSFDTGAITRLLNEFPGLVVIDEAYIDFSKNNSWLQKLSQYPNMVITQTFSKAYGMAGLRLGACYASKDIIGILNKIKPPYNVNERTQQEVFQRIDTLDVLQQHVSNIKSERDRLASTLLLIPFIEKVYNSDANFLLAKVDDADKRYAEILKKGIVVRNRTNQPLCGNTLRFTVGTKEENDTLINVLTNLV